MATRINRNANVPRHIAVNPMRIHDAAASETPKPVAKAIYAATHIGHLGTKAKMVVGTIHFVEPASRRMLEVWFADAEFLPQQKSSVMSCPFQEVFAPRERGTRFPAFFISQWRRKIRR
jgi:hypothetical protein